MDQQNAKTLLDDTFNHGYDESRFLNFIRELFNGFDANPKERYISKEYKSYVDSCQTWGSYTNGNEAIDVLVVKLNKETASWDRARTKQRNFVAKQLSEYKNNAALVAFYGDDSEDWRFSFVKLDYNFELDGTGNRKIVQDLTPAKRYSYLVGLNEPNHTCRKQFLDFIIKEDTNPTIEKIENAFSIDNVTQEFFLEYKELFLELNKSLSSIVENDVTIKDDFDQNNISSVDFSKKLMGQIVFLYFLQKKGWLGVERGNEWGTGPKDFMVKLFGNRNKGISPLVPYNNFFNDILEPLFYDALSNSRGGEDGYYTHFKCKIPFLNGGLFEPINAYDWVNTEIHLDNKIFEKIFEIFNRFNFTIKEDEPLDKEVAVDPEMLGKVFENLLTVVDRKSKGAFYTPREIVHYMCQQSLINYLETNTDVPAEDVEVFIQRGEFSQQITSRTDVVNKYIPTSIKDNSGKIDDLLKNIRIVDPAVGSGAFPMGMMNEIVKARSILSWLSKGEKRSHYDLKRETIENCLYGVDIDFSAVDITKLRFWLSLVVDETDIKKIKPLPNLDHRIMCGNSLLEEFEGTKLFDEQLLEIIPETRDFELEQVDADIQRLYLELGDIHTGKRKDNGRKKEIETELKKLDRTKKTISSRPKDNKLQSTLDQSFESKRKESREKLFELRQLHKKYFNEQNRTRKRELTKKIDEIEWDLVEETLNEQDNENAMQKLTQYKKTKSKPFFLWKLYFAEVFQRENPGFDVVIANPPYLIVKETNTSAQILKNYSDYYCADFKINLFALFIEKSIKVCRRNGFISYIVPDSSLNLPAFTKLREFIITKNSLKNVSYYKENVFENVSIGKSIILFIEKNNSSSSYIFRVFNNKTEYIDTTISYSNILKDKNLKFTYNFSDEIENNLFYKLRNTKSTLDEYCDIYDGINPGSKILKDLFISEIYINEFSKKIIDGKDFTKYSRVGWGGNYIFYNKEYVQKVKNDLKNDGTSFTARIIKKVNFFEREKIVTRQTADTIIGTIDGDNHYVKNSVHSTLIKNKYKDKIFIQYILAILNSELINWYYRKESSESGRLFPQVKIAILRKLPIKQISPEQQKPFIQLVDQILGITSTFANPGNPQKQSQVKTLESQIDQLVYKLYDLTPEEIAIVENFNGGK